MATRSAELGSILLGIVGATAGVVIVGSGLEAAGGSPHNTIETIIYIASMLSFGVIPGAISGALVGSLFARAPRS